uniref:FAS-associated factor 1-like isoform X2 n=1 Tax=Halichoerus grypus TaxID=9711 RepID=UPI001658D9E6|nr:FAS-associated factor 1-like isoform X2 [Halichoerus grypus]
MLFIFLRFTSPFPNLYLKFSLCFQACTGIENIDEAITLLEQNNWDLVAAINGVIPQENGILQSDYGGETIPGPAFDPSHPASVPAPSSSSAFRPVMPSRQIVERQPRMLDFRVEYRDRNVDVVLEDSCTVGEIKQILENELQIPVSKMLLKGWKTGDVEDSTVLKSLHLPKTTVFMSLHGLAATFII